MDSSSTAYAILIQWAAQSPALLIYLAGIAAALAYWQRCQVPAVLTLCALVLLGALTLMMPVIWVNFPRWQSEHALSLKQMGSISLTISVISSVVHAVGIALLLTAVFYRRPAPVFNVPLNSPPPLPIP